MRAVYYRTPIFGLLLMALPAIAAAQLPGDSVRARPPGGVWMYGRAVSVSGPFLIWSQDGVERELPLAALERLDVRERQDPGPVLGGMVAAGMTGILLSHFLTPEAQRRQDLTVPLAIGAGVGLFAGAIVLSIQPYRWKAVIRR